MPHAVQSCTTLENVDVECTHCNVRMTSHLGGGGTIRYFHCPSCSRWTTSVYTEVLRADSKMRARRPLASPAPTAFGSVKERVERWLQSLSESDPYCTLGVSPRATDHELRERYLALARTHHPDRGGQPEAKRRLNDAYERVLAHRAQQRLGRAELLPSGA
jgi:hypothetical protein